MGGGGESTAERYAKFGAGEYSSSDFERYVDSRPDLAAAWAKIESDPTAWDSKYWIDKGATSKSAFGRAHAAEDAALYAGTYGDSGDTKVLPGTPEYEAYFGDGGGTYFDSFISSPSGEGGGGGSSMVGPGNPYYPQRVSAFTPRTAQDWSAYMPAGSPLAVNKGILYQADINSQGIPDSIWNYQPPMLYASGGGGGLSIGTGGGGGLSIGTTGGGHFIPTGMLSVESPSSGGFAPGDVVAVSGNTSGTPITLGELVAASDASNTSPRFSPGTGLSGNPDLRADRAATAINAHVTQGLIDHTPSLQQDFAIVNQGGDYQADQAQARIDAIAREILKENPKAILGGNTSMSSPVSMVVNTAIPLKSGGSYIPADAHLAQPGK